MTGRWRTPLDAQGACAVCHQPMPDIYRLNIPPEPEKHSALCAWDVGRRAASEQAMRALIYLIDEGWLVGVEVFGTTCDVCESDYGYGLCDSFSKNTPAGSDCNRAERFLLRPADELMTADIDHLIHDEGETT